MRPLSGPAVPVQSVEGRLTGERGAFRHGGVKKAWERERRESIWERSDRRRGRGRHPTSERNERAIRTFCKSGAAKSGPARSAVWLRGYGRFCEAVPCLGIEVVECEQGPPVVCSLLLSQLPKPSSRERKKKRFSHVSLDTNFSLCDSLEWRAAPTPRPFA